RNVTGVQTCALPILPSINSNKLRNFKIPYVNKTLQKNIVEILNKKTQKIDKLISSTQQSIEELKKYKQSLITEAVTKGLDPNVRSEERRVGNECKYE